MGKFIDLTGWRFGRLVVTNKAGVKKNRIYWQCDCDCGNTKIIAGRDLRERDVISCGCYKKELNSSRCLIDLTGRRFGRLVVIEQEKTASYSLLKRKRIRWSCQCDCNNIAVVEGSNLKNGTTKSCGCLHKEMARRNKKSGEAAFNTIYNSYIRHSKKRNLSFNLTKQEFKNLTLGNCFYCGCEPSQIVHTRWGNGNYIYNGIDRLNNATGYEKTNCVSCCGLCNTRKTDMRLDDFLNWVEKIHNYQKEKSEKNSVSDIN